MRSGTPERVIVGLGAGGGTDIIGRVTAQKRIKIASPLVKRAFSFIVFVLSLIFAANPSAQNYPAKPVRMVVPFAPGGGTDTVARVIGQKLAEIWPYPVVIDNRAGAGSMIGTEITARAAADGYTIATISMTHAINVSVYRKLPYDPVNDFAPVILAATTANILVIHPSVPARSVKELIALAKARPGQLNYPSSGVGGVSHLAAHMFSSVAGIDNYADKHFAIEEMLDRDFGAPVCQP